MNGSNILSEKTKAKLKSEFVRVCRSVAAVLLGEVSSSLNSFSKDIASKVTSSLDTVCPEKISNTGESEAK